LHSGLVLVGLLRNIDCFGYKPPMIPSPNNVQGVLAWILAKTKLQGHVTRYRWCIVRSAMCGVSRGYRGPEVRMGLG
jgi:hypothetical protein